METDYEILQRISSSAPEYGRSIVPFQKKQYLILECLAVKHMKWTAITIEYGYSQSSISRIRKVALNEIRCRFMKKMKGGRA